MRPKKQRRNINWFLLGLISLVGIGIVSYFWATGMIDGLDAYRSPLAYSPPTPGSSIGQPLTRKVVIVLIDALRYDTSMDSAVMPFLNELRSEGAVAVMKSRPPSFSAPGWATILTGAWPDINDSQVFNPPDAYSARPFTQDNIFAAAHRVGIKTAISGYSWFEQMLASSQVDQVFSTTGEDMLADQEVIDHALPWLTEDYQLVLIHLDQVDYAGHHEGGPKSSNWNAAAARADKLLAQIAARLDLAQDTLIIISDHGQIDIGGHGGTESVVTTEPFVAVGAGILPGSVEEISMVDIAPTLAVLLGTNIPASSQGRPLLEFLDIASDRVPSLLSDIKLQQTQLFTAYTYAIKGTAVMTDTGATVSSTQLAMEQARMGRLANERVWRNMISMFLLLVPGYSLVIRRQKKMLWLIGTVVTYLIIFNFRYLILDQKTYSVSSIPGVMEFILYIAITSSIAFMVGWMLPMFGLQAFRQGARKAASISLEATWFLIYILMFPVLLNFAVNGVIPTWTLPEFKIQFFGFFALAQIIIISALGLLLASVSALAGKFLITEE